MKRLFVSILFMFTLGELCAMSIPIAITNEEKYEVEKFFNNYIDSANNYKDGLINLYLPDAKIERVVIKPDGNKETVTIPMKRYIKELKNGKKTAKLVNYKNTYTNKKIEKIKENEFKIKTTRIPFKDKKGLSAEFVVTKTPHGLKISEESMETTVQKFLSQNN